jgi:hypothetical protein
MMTTVMMNIISRINQDKLWVYFLYRCMVEGFPPTDPPCMPPEIMLVAGQVEESSLQDLLITPDTTLTQVLRL